MSIMQPDEQLILQMAGGDRNAFRELYRQTSSAVYGFALSILKNRQDAEDVMQDAFLRIFTGAGSYRPKGHPLAWILTIVKNLCYNRIRDGKLCEDLSSYDDPAGKETAGSSEQLLDRMILEKALDLLDFEERQIVILHALTGLKHREIAKILDLPLGTVLSKYNRSLKKMRNELEGKGE